jgi:dihydrofolate reductase
MRKIIVSEFMSLDGVIEDPGGAEGFEHGGWTFPYWSDEIGRFKWEELFASDAMLLGRITYEGFAAAWPSRTDEQGFAERMNSLPKFVVSTTLTEAEWQNSTVVKGDVRAEIAKLKEQSGGDILVAGSAQLVQTLAQNDLVDEYRLLVYPVVLGSGKRLFSDGKRSDLELRETRSFDSGVVLASYGPPRVGSG